MQQRSIDPKAVTLLEAVAQRGRSIQSLSLDTLLEVSTRKVQGHLDFKRPLAYRSLRADRRIIALSNQGRDIQLDTLKKTYVKSPFSSTTLRNLLPYLEGWPELHSAELASLKYLGTERLGAVTCDVVRGDIVSGLSLESSGWPTQITRLYIGPDRLIYRVRNERDGGKDISQTTYSQVVINPSLPDSMFLLPPGYTPGHGPK
jgi:hypothetical protein